MLAALDAPLHALVRSDPDVLIPLVARQRRLRSLLLFTDPDVAAAHLDALPAQPAGGWTRADYRAEDWRGKEELLRAAATLGATRVDLDPDLDLTARHDLVLDKALAYVSSYKRATACL